MPRKLVVLERSEFNLFSIERELRKYFPDLALEVALVDVCDSVSVEKTLKRHVPDIIFHAAAYKHVPMLEAQTRAAAMNNIFGTGVRSSGLAEKFGCKSFVLISTDKAVNPANTMGATKRVAEMICQHQSTRSPTKYITVRFGNVMGSSGSVIPLFQDQIVHGGPVTVTHPDVTRYFMTIPEACQLILQASVIGRGSEIFVLDMGDPVRIAYLAEQMIRLSGKVPGEDIEIVIHWVTSRREAGRRVVSCLRGSGKTGYPKIFLASSRPVNGEFLGGKCWQRSNGPAQMTTMNASVS